MTEEVGAITGDLEVVTYAKAGSIEVTVRYAGADEGYTVQGSPVKPGDPEGRYLRELHERVVEHLTTSGKIGDGNDEPVSLYGFSP